MIYLDNCASSRFKPYEVIDAVKTAISCPFNPSRSSHAPAERAGIMLNKAREQIAHGFNTLNERVIFCSGCTEALNLALIGLQLKNAHVITTILEHNAVLRPLYQLERRGLISLSIVKSPSEAVRQIKRNTVLLVVNHVSNVTGEEADLDSYAQIAHSYRLILLVDGAQSGGYKPLDIKKRGIDMLGLASHKGLHGIQGSGALLVKESLDFKLQPIRFGGTGGNASMVDLQMPDSYEAGTPATPAICGFGAGVEWSLRHIKQNANRLYNLSAELISRFKGLDVEVFSQANECGIVSFRLKNMLCNDACDLFDSRFGIALRCGFHCAPLVHKHLNTDGLIRCSFGVESDIDDVDAMYFATKELCK